MLVVLVVYWVGVEVVIEGELVVVFVVGVFCGVEVGVLGVSIL